MEALASVDEWGRTYISCLAPFERVLGACIPRFLYLNGINLLAKQGMKPEKVYLLRQTSGKGKY
jgi:hypothetical protein